MSALPEPALEESPWERRARNRSPSARWIGWRLRALVLAALAGCLAMFLLLRVLATQPALTVPLALDARGALQLAMPAISAPLDALVTRSGEQVPVDALLMHRGARWLASDVDRLRHRQQHDALAAALAEGQVKMIDRRGVTHNLEVAPRGAAGLGWVFWLLAVLALLLYLVTMVVVLSRPETRNALYALMAFSQVGNLLFLGVLSAPAIGWPAGFMVWEHDLRTGFDLLTAVAFVHVTNLHPRPLPGAGGRSALAWLAVAVVAMVVTLERVSHTWWWTQSALLACTVVSTAQLAWMQRRQPHPLALQLLRFTLLASVTLLLLSLTVVALGSVLDARTQAASIGSTVWVVFLSSMLLMLPFVTRTQVLTREFLLLAAVTTLATALDLLFVAMFSLGNFASLTLALFVSLALYVGARQWLLARMVSRQRLTTERMFEHLYRIAREVQTQPRRLADRLGNLLAELFQPLNVQTVARRTQRARVVADGASLVVPVPELQGAADAPPVAIVLGLAERGRRLFTEEDARLADRIVEQIARAVAYDQAVERGRTEERVRLAQDLHDDIGARLLTLMYRAPTPEMEDYVRHTLKDLKTLTRGLAAPSHLLSHAVAEWKADIQQRVAAADCQLGWAFAYESDFELSVVQWSALTRVLRELVSNALSHAQASRVDVQASVGGGLLVLSVLDDGIGRSPQSWSHGLGLGGVRKRVKQLGGHVVWRENGERGIACRVSVPGFGPT